MVTVVIGGLLLYSRKNIKVVVYASIILQIRIHITIFQIHDVLEAYEDPRNILYNTFGLTVFVVMNQVMLNHVLTRRKLLCSVINATSLILGLTHRLYGWDNVKKNLVQVVLNIIWCVALICLFIYTNQAVNN